MLSRYLGLDYGEKRIGVAVSDPLAITAQPQAFIPNDAQTIVKLQALIDEYSIVAIILGLPTNRYKEETQQSKIVKAFSLQLSAHLNIPIFFQDERLSTQAVEKTLLSANMSRKKRKQYVDSMAAAFILQGYLDKHRHAS